MPALENHRHEKFAQALAEGLTPAKAYVAAGYAAHSTRAHELADDNAEIRFRVEQLRRIARGEPELERKHVCYYGFHHDTSFDSASWFHTYEAAARYAKTSGMGVANIQTMWEYPDAMSANELLDKPAAPCTDKTPE